MKDMTAGEFCRKFDVCKDGRQWAYGLTKKKSKAMMSEIWEYLGFSNHLGWVMTRDGVMSERDLRLFACKCMRETPLADGRKVWDLLTDERSRNAVAMAERYATGQASEEELSAARAAAWAAAEAAARAAAGDAVWDALAAARAAWAARAAAGDAVWNALAAARAAWAARAAAGDAVWNARAARAAAEAARDAVWAAAEAAARAAAGDAVWNARAARAAAEAAAAAQKAFLANPFAGEE